jgi:RAP domain
MSASAAARKISRNLSGIVDASSPLLRASELVRSQLQTPNQSSHHEFNSMLQAICSLERNQRKEKFPKPLMFNLIKTVSSMTVDSDNFNGLLKLASSLCDDKIWKIGDLVQNLNAYFQLHSNKLDKFDWQKPEQGKIIDFTARRVFSTSESVDVLKMNANLSKVLNFTVEQTEQLLNFALEILRSPDFNTLSIKETSFLLWSLVTIRRSRNFSSSNHYRKREGNFIFELSDIQKIRDHLLLVLEKLETRQDYTTVFHLTQIAWSLASCGVWSRPAMNKLSEVLASNFDLLTMREIGLFLWSMAVAGIRNEAFIEKTVSYSLQNGKVDPIIPWSLKILGTELPETVKSKEFPHKNDESRPANTSGIHVEIGQRLENLGFNVIHEITLDDSLSVDVAIEIGDKKWAIEVDGPYHFVSLCDGTSKHSGASEYKFRRLKEFGWNVVSIEVRKYSMLPKGYARTRELVKMLPAELTKEIGYVRNS